MNKEKFEAIKEQLDEKLKLLQNKWRLFLPEVRRFFQKLIMFLYNHKAISICVVVFILLTLLVVGVGNHYLSKINYVERDESATTLEQPVLITLGTGEVISVYKSRLEINGYFVLSDGRIYYENGSIKNTDGSIIFNDGSYLTSDGIAVLCDGITIYPDGYVVFPDGDFIGDAGVTVDKEGYAIFDGGEKLHISTFTIEKNGNVIMKEGSDGSTVIKLSEDEEDDSILQNADSKELKENDKLIELNSHNNEIWYSDDVLNVLLMGIDEGSSSFPYGRSDAMILVSINKKTKKIKLISVSRTAYVAIPGYNNTRLNHAHGYGGADLAIRTIEDNYKIRIDNYVSTNFDAFEALIDAVGGVDITLTSAEAKALKSKLKENGYEYKGEGSYKLNGPMALEYVRLRKIDSDRDRTQRQRNILTALADRAMNMNIFQLNVLLNNVLPYITTDLSKFEIVSQLTNVPSYLSNGFEQYVLPHKSSKLTLIDDYEVVLVDWEDEVKYTHELIYSDVEAKYYTR